MRSPPVGFSNPQAHIVAPSGSMVSSPERMNLIGVCRMMRWAWMLVAAASLGRVGAADVAAADPVALTAEQIEFFEKQVRPVLVNRCYEWHPTRVTIFGEWKEVLMWTAFRRSNEVA